MPVTDPRDDIPSLTPQAAAVELASLADAINAANMAYHRDDAPTLSDAEYDRLKLRNTALEAAFPDLKRADSPTDRVGGDVADGF
ncbi:MAG: NAD-dependent DNA ligase LigA, partial [Alphaproteobacteria bacterium]|nr:NAD-dependent DNA ligase LigA [Alphaproteobacteria bacterium]